MHKFKMQYNFVSKIFNMGNSEFKHESRQFFNENFKVKFFFTIPWMIFRNQFFQPFPKLEFNNLRTRLDFRRFQCDPFYCKTLQLWPFWSRYVFRIAFKHFYIIIIFNFNGFIIPRQQVLLKFVCSFRRRWHCTFGLIEFAD